MLSTKKSAQTLVFIAFFPFITIPTAKSGLNNKSLLILKSNYQITGNVSFRDWPLNEIGISFKKYVSDLTN